MKELFEKILPFITRENITLLIAVIGCLGGVIGVYITVHKHYISTRTLDIKKDMAMLCAFDKKPFPKGMGEKVAIISIALVNKSSTPITIYGCHITVNKITRTPKLYEDVSFELKDGFYEPEYPRNVNIELEKTCEFPLSLDAYGSKKITMYFKHFPNAAPNTTELKVILNTSKRDAKYVDYF